LVEAVLMELYCNEWRNNNFTTIMQGTN